MKRMIAPNDTVREVEIKGARFGGSRTYQWSKDGTIHVNSAADVKALKEAGFTEAGVNQAGGKGGYVCSTCGFHMWFTTCSRCGGEGERW
jgi:hypothetical protein